MKEFLFFTTQGFTYDPNNKEIENMQILGSGIGADILEAFKCFKDNHVYLKEYAFTDVIAVECAGNYIRHLEL
jgi:hypothetical protein